MIHTGMKWPNGENAATARSLWQELLVSMNQSIDYPSSVNSAFTRFSQTHCSRHDQGLRHQSSNRLTKPEREEHCSTLVGLASALLQNIIPIEVVFCICIPLPKLRKRTCSLGGIRHPNSRCAAMWCGVMWQLMCQVPSCSIACGTEEGGYLSGVCEPSKVSDLRDGLTQAHAGRGYSRYLRNFLNTGPVHRWLRHH
jgi:hypothetical protein